MASNQLLASKITVEEERPATRQIPTVDTLVMAFVGIAEKGPINEATLVQSFTEFVDIFGSYLASSDLASAVEGFFENGGTGAYIVRIVHYSDITNDATKTSTAATKTITTDALAATSGEVTSANTGPYNLEPSQTLIVKIDGGSNQTFTFAATAGTRTSGSTGPYDLADGQTLTVAIDGGSPQTVTFNASAVSNIDAVTATEAATIINAALVGASASVVGNAVKITSDRRGTGSGVNVTGGSANAALNFTTGNSAGTGNASNIDAVTAAEVVSLLSTLTGSTASVSGGAVRIVSSSTGASSSVQVTSGSTATAVGFDNAVHAGISAGTLNTLKIDGKYDGTYANSYRVKIGAATSGDGSEFNLDLIDSTGLVLESFPNLTMDSTASRYVEDVVNNAKSGSKRIAATDLEATGTATQRRPINGTTTAMSGGGDGLASIGDTDYVGSSASATGLRALDVVDELTLLAVPGIATSAVHNAIITYCEATRGGQVFGILDPPADNTASEIVTYVTSTAAIGGLSEYAAIYWPRISISNPNKTVFGKDDEVIVAPSGHIAGMYARNDNAKPVGGVWTQPAGTEEGKLFNVLGFETDTVLKEEVRDLVFPKRINPITTMKGFPRFVDGARTLKGDGNFPSVGQRRGVSFVERSIKLGLQFARHKNNTPELRAECYRTVFAFLKGQMDADAFASKDPDLAFFVDFGDALNTIANQVIGRIGLATNEPAEYVRLKFSQDTRALDSAANS